MVQSNGLSLLLGDSLGLGLGALLLGCLTRGSLALLRLGSFCLGLLLRGLTGGLVGVIDDLPAVAGHIILILPVIRGKLDVKNLAATLLLQLYRQGEQILLGHAGMVQGDLSGLGLSDSACGAARQNQCQAQRGQSFSQPGWGQFPFHAVRLLFFWYCQYTRRR